MLKYIKSYLAQNMKRKQYEEKIIIIIIIRKLDGIASMIANVNNF